MAEIQQLAEPDEEPATRFVADNRCRNFMNSLVVSATVQDGSTVLTLADRSKIVFVGVARIDQLTLFGGGPRRG